MPSSQPDITQLLQAIGDGDAGAGAQLMPVVYDELRQLAHRQLRRERTDHTLNTTALVHEAYLKLVQQDAAGWRNRGHFFGIAVQAMRRILVDYARRRIADKRGGGLAPVSLDEATIKVEERAVELIALDEALTRLAGFDERAAKLVECRFFGGLSIDETADALGVSPATVKRDWAAARAWLYRELRR